MRFGVPRAAHGEHEKRSGQRDANWAGLVRNVHGGGAGRNGAAALSDDVLANSKNCGFWLPEQKRQVKERIEN